MPAGIYILQKNYSSPTLIVGENTPGIPSIPYPNPGPYRAPLYDFCLRPDPFPAKTGTLLHTFSKYAIFSGFTPIGRFYVAL